MDSKKIGNILLVIIVLVVIGIVVKKLMDKLRDSGQNFMHNYTPAGWFGGVRGAEAQASANSLLKLPFLTDSFYRKVEPKYNTSRYTVDIMGTEKAQEIARIIKDSNSLIPGGFMDDSARAVVAILQIENQAQAGEVTHAYRGLTGKDLNRGISWLSDPAMIEVAAHFNNLKTGIIDNQLNPPRELQTITI